MAADTLREIPLEDAPNLDEWVDITDLAEGFDVLSKQGEVALVVHMPEGFAHLGLHMDAEGAVALGNALLTAAAQAAE
jgi:hypothetical protein